MECGLLAGNVPYLRSGAGPHEAIVFPGASALFRPLDQMADPGRFARQIAALLPRHRFTILYTGGGRDRIVPALANAIGKPPDVLMGISLGGMVAMPFAARHPELVKRLVILAGPAETVEGRKEGTAASPAPPSSAHCYFDREAYEETTALIPGARLRLFEKETRMLPMERSGAVASAIGESLAEN